MLIDWFTVAAQLINFVILLVVLKFVLYDRVVAAMAERQERISAEMEEATRRQEEAEQEAEEARAEKRRLEAERDEILGEAREQAEERRSELLDEARREADEQERRWREALESRRERLLDELAEQTGRQAVAVSRRALRDLADAELEERILRGFVRRLSDDGGELARTLEEHDGPLVVATAFELGDDRREELRRALEAAAGDAAREIEWRRDDGLTAGITVTAGARTISWTIDDYLDDLSERFTRTIRQHTGGSEAESSGSAGGESAVDA